MQPWLDPALYVWHPSWLCAGELRAGGAVKPPSLPRGVTLPLSVAERSGACSAWCPVPVPDAGALSSPSSPLSAVIMECCARLCPALGSGTGSTLGTATPCAHRGNGTGERCRTGTAAAVSGLGAGPSCSSPLSVGWLHVPVPCRELGELARGSAPLSIPHPCLCPQIRSKELARGRCRHQKPHRGCRRRLSCSPSLAPPPGLLSPPAQSEGAGPAARGQGPQGGPEQAPRQGPLWPPALLRQPQAVRGRLLPAWGGALVGAPPQPPQNWTQLQQPALPSGLSL